MESDPLTAHRAGVPCGGDVRISRRLSLVLRHAPESIGISLDEHGWVPVEQLLAALGRAGFPVTRDDLERVVAESDKQRFAFDAAGEQIRASQGHSVPVDLELEPLEPPARLFHGTTLDRWPSIQRSGLLPQRRHHVHLSVDVQTAARVGGRRRGALLVLTVAAAAMAEAGHLFYCSANGVWLTETVPAHFLTVSPTQ